MVPKWVPDGAPREPHDHGAPKMTPLGGLGAPLGAHCVPNEPDWALWGLFGGPLWPEVTQLDPRGSPGGHFRALFGRARSACLARGARPRLGGVRVRFD